MAFFFPLRTAAWKLYIISHPVIQRGGQLSLKSLIKDHQAGSVAFLQTEGKSAPWFLKIYPSFPLGAKISVPTS